MNGAINEIKTRVFDRLFAQAAVADAQETAAMHARLATELAATTRTTAAALKDLEAKRPKVAAEYEKALAQTDAARARLIAVDGEIERLKLERISKGGRLEGQLASAADPRIDEAVRRMEARLADVQRGGFKTESVRIVDQIGGHPWLVKTNERAIGRVVSACSAARQSFQALKLVEVDDVPAAIARIEQGIPWTDLNVLEGPDGAGV